MKVIKYFIGASVLIVNKISSALILSSDDQVDLLVIMLEHPRHD